MSIANQPRLIAKILVGTAIGFGALIGAAAPAGADPATASTNPSPFSTLSCSCRETAPAGSPLLKDEIDRGIAAGRSDRLPGMPAPRP